MQPNPSLKKLRLSERDRVVIFHADDIGMCQASLDAYEDLVSFGLLSSAAVMVPCSWFPATAAFCRANQDSKRIDMGVHLTLTSEWDSYRWGPISTRNAASGLMDEEGYFYRSSEEAQAHLDPAAAVSEIEAQIQRAIAAGIDISHIDTHMGSVFHPALLAGYIQNALKYRVPAMILRQDRQTLEKTARDMGAPLPMIELYVQQMESLEAKGFPMLDHIIGMPLEEHENRLQRAVELVESLPAGITHFLVHPSKDTPELRAITPDWRARVADYQLFMDERWRAHVASCGIHVIGYKHLRELMRGS